MKTESYISITIFIGFIIIGGIFLILDSRKYIKRKRIKPEVLARKERGRTFVEHELPENDD